ncbi:MAG: Maf family protein [Actinomycetales bacterium]
MTAAVDLVLASASPARLAVLRAAGLRPRVQVSAVDEDAQMRRDGVSEPTQVALALATAKCLDVAAGIDDALVLGCDSVLEFDGQTLGKPPSPQAARDRWRAMSGRTGVLHTGHWLVDTRGEESRAAGEVASTTVHFAELTPAEIDAYVATGEPLRVAGAFTVDGLGGAFVQGIEGDHYNVVGVSLPLLRRLCQRLGVPWTDLWVAAPQGPA